MKFLSHLKRFSVGLLTAILVKSESILSLIFSINDIQSNKQNSMANIISIIILVIFCVTISYLYFDLSKRQKLLSTIIRIRTIPNSAPEYFVNKYRNEFKPDVYISPFPTSNENEINNREKNIMERNQNIEYNKSLRYFIDIEFEKNSIIEFYRSKKEEFSDIDRILNSIYELNSDNK